MSSKLSSLPPSPPPRVTTPLPLRTETPPPRIETPPPRVIKYDSDSSSDSDTLRRPLKIPDSKYAEVEAHTNKLPTLHKGDTSALVCSEFTLQCQNYFDAKDVPADCQVAKIIGCFRDPRVANWIRPERAKFTAMTFEVFMEAFRKKFLRADWEQLARGELLSSRMKTDETFSTWSTNIASLHSLLVGTPSELDDTHLRHTLEAGMLPELSRLYSKDKKTNAIAADQLDE